MLRLLVFASAGVLVILIASTFLLPLMVKRQVVEAFRKAGLPKVSFDLIRATPWQARLAAIVAGEDQWLRVGTVTVDYSPIDAANGRIRSVRIRDAQLTLPWEWLGTSATDRPTAPLPFELIELDFCTLTIVRGPQPFDAVINGTVVQDSPGIAQIDLKVRVVESTTLVSGAIDLGSGSINVRAIGRESQIAPWMHLLPPDAQSAIGDVSGMMDFEISYHRDRTKSSASAVIEAQNLDYGGQKFKNLRTRFEIKSPAEILFSHAAFDWGGGSIALKPFRASLSPPAIEAVVTAMHLDVKHLMELIPNGQVTGSGEVSGTLPIRVDELHVTFGEGVIESDGPGTLVLGESVSALGTILEQSDPRFARDNQMRQLKNQILDALKDFAFDRVRAEFKRMNDELVIAVRIQGQGRTGAHQPLDVTLNFRGLEHGLNTYLSGRSRVLEFGSERQRS